MSDADLQGAPHHPVKEGKQREDAWWYEEPAGISVIVQHRQGATGTTIVDIPWRSIAAALRRKRKKKRGG